MGSIAFFILQGSRTPFIANIDLAIRAVIPCQ